MYRCKSWTIKKFEHQRTDGFELWCWRRLLRVPWSTGSSKIKPVNLKEMNPEYSLDGLMLKLKLQYFGHLMSRAGKDPDAGQDWGQGEKDVKKDEMVQWHHQLNGHEFEQTPGDSEGQGSLVCCSPWRCKELDTTERLNWNKGNLEINFLKTIHEI